MKIRSSNLTRVKHLPEGLAEVTVSPLEDGFWSITRIIVPKNSRGQGIAKELLQEVVELQEDYQSIIYAGVEDCYGGLDVPRFVKSLCKIGFVEIWRTGRKESGLIRFPEAKKKEDVLAILDPHSRLAERIWNPLDNALDIKRNPEILHLVDIDAIQLALGKECNDI